MALTGVDRGSGNNNSLLSSWTMAPTSNFTSGSYAVIIVSYDNSGTSGADPFLAITDTKNNLWVTRQLNNYTTGSAGSGVSHRMFTTKLNGTFTTSDSVTLAVSVACQSKCWSFIECDASSLDVVYTTGDVNVGSVDANPTITTSSIPNGSMVIGSAGSEETNSWVGDTDTDNGTWSTHQTAGSNAGTGGIGHSSQWKVVTATATQTYNPTHAATKQVLAWLQLDEATDPFPKVRAKSQGRTTTSNTTTHAITLPSSPAVGEVLVVVFSSDGSPTVTVNTGASGNNWTKLGQASNGSICTGAIFYKVAEGSDALTLTTSAGEQSSHVCYAITGASGTVDGTSSNGSSTNSDPGSHTPAGGSKNYLWLATRSGDSTVVATGAPTDFGALYNYAAAGTGGASSTGSEREFTGSVLDPATFTSASEQWVCWTLAIYPTDNPTGTIAQDHKPLEQSVTGGVYGTGTISQTMLPLEQSATGGVYGTGTITQTMLPLEQSATGTVSAGTITGTIAQDHKPLEQSATGGVFGTGTITQDHKPLEQSASGGVQGTGTITQDHKPLEQSASGGVYGTGTITQTMLPLEQSATGTVSTGTVTGTITQTHQPLEQSITATVSTFATIAQDHKPLEQSATGTVSTGSVTGTITQDHKPLEQSATAVVSTFATIAQDHKPLEQSATGTVSAGAATGTIAQDHKPLEQSATGGVFGTGTISQEIKPFEQEATGGIFGTGVIEQTHKPLEQEAIGTVSSGVTGTISQEIQPFEQVLSGEVTGDVAQPDDGGSTGGGSSEPVPIPKITRKKAKERLKKLIRKAKKRKLIPREIAALNRIESWYPDEVPAILRSYLLGVYMPMPELELQLPEPQEYALDFSWLDEIPEGIFGGPIISDSLLPQDPYAVPRVELAQLDADEMLLLQIADAEDDEELAMALAG